MVRVLLGMVAAVVLAVGLALGLAVYNLEALINDYRGELSAHASEYLGRQVIFGPVRITWEGGLGAEFRDVRLAGAEAAAPEQLFVPRLFLKLDVMKMLRARGRRLEVKEAVLSQPQLKLRRDKQGAWDVEDIVRHVTRKAEETARTSDKSANDYFRELEIAGTRVDNARVAIADEHLGQTYTVEGINIAMSTIVPGKNVNGDVSLTLDDGVAKAPLKAHLEILPLPADLDFSDWPTVRSSIKLQNLELGTWGRLVPAQWVRPEQGRLEVNITADINPDDDLAVVKGKLLLSALQLTQKGQKGQQGDIAFDMYVDAGLNSPTLKVHNLDVRGPGLVLDTRLTMHQRALEGIEDARLDVSVEDLARLLAILPEGNTLVPPELVLQGPFEVHVQGDADEGHLQVTLDKARVAYAKVLDKGHGTPLHLELTATRQNEGVLVDPISLQLDQANVAANVFVPRTLKGPYRASINTGELDLKRLHGLFPAVVAARKDGIAVDGKVRLSVDAEPKDGLQEIRADLTARALDIRLSGLTLKGDGNVTVTAEPDRQGNNHAELLADLGGLDVQVKKADGALVFNKKRKVSSDAHAKVTLTRKDLLVEALEINVGGSNVFVDGAVRGVHTAAPELDLRSQQLLVDVDDVRSMVPGTAGLPKGGTLSAHVVAKGQPKTPSTIAVRVDTLDLALGANKVTGEIGAKDLENPVVVARLDTVALDFSQLARVVQVKGLPRKGTVSGAVTFQGAVRDLRTMSIAAEDVEANVFGTAVRGRAKVDNLEEPVFDIQAESEKIDVGLLQREIAAVSGPPARVEKQEENTKGLAPGTRKALRKVRGRAQLDVDQVKVGKYDLRNVSAVLTMVNSKVEAEKLEWTLYGGRWVGTGSQVRMGEEWIKDHIVLKVRGLNLARAVDAHSEEGGRVSGMLDADFDLVSRGMTADDVLQSVNGPISVASNEVNVVGLNMLGQMFSRLQAVAPVPFPLAQHGLLDPDAPTAFSNVALEGRFAAHKFTTTRPFKADTEFGTLQLSGEVFTDSRLNLVGSASVKPQVVEDITNGAIRATGLPWRRISTSSPLSTMSSSSDSLALASVRENWRM